MLHPEVSDDQVGVYHEALEALTPEERHAALDAVSTLGSIAAGTRIVQNLQTEMFLPVDVMQELLRQLARAAGSTPAELLRRFAEACVAHVGSGGAVQCNPLPKLVGRVVSRAEFEKHLVFNCRTVFHGSKRAVSRFVGRLVKIDVALSVSEGGLPMSPYAAWVTSDHDTPARDQPPFTFRRSTSYLELECALGLRPDLRKPLLLLVYATDQLHGLIRPTSADAGTYEFFAPPPTKSTCCGRTCPWPEAHLPKHLRFAAANRRPEAIHERAPFNVLRVPVETVP